METNKKRKKEHSTVTLPKELISEILVRLPARSVLRFRLVCKLWLSLISDPQFAKLHFDVSAVPPSYRLLLKDTGDVIESFDMDASLSDGCSAVAHLRLPPPLTGLSDCHFTNCGSCRGFVLLLHRVTKFHSNLVVWNPLTSVYRQIPVDFVVEPKVICGFGYDASTDDYLIIFINFTSVHAHRFIGHSAMIKIFSLKSNSWDCHYIRMKYVFSSFFPNIDDLKVGSLLNGALHWLVYSPNLHVRLIMAFDLVKRSLSVIPLPPPVLKDRFRCRLKVIGGCLGVWCFDEETRGEMWMMEEYKVLSSWKRTFISDYGQAYVNSFNPICLTKDNTLLGLDLSLPTYPRRLRLRKLHRNTEWLPEHFTYGTGRNIQNWNVQSCLYRESLLSLPNDSQKQPKVTEN